MKILFTKTDIEKVVSEQLGNNFFCDFKDFIKIEFKEIEHFDTSSSNLIFTSKNGVLGFLKNGFSFVNNPKIFTVGSKTKKAVEENGGKVSENFKNIEELSQYSKNFTEKETFLHFCGNLTLETAEKAIENYRKIEVYETHLLFPKISEKYDAVVFFSPSSVRSFAAENSFENCKLFSIGETTSAEIRNFTQSEVFTSKKNNLENLISIVKSTMY